jgi:hypothetical protein
MTYIRPADVQKILDTIIIACKLSPDAFKCLNTPLTKKVFDRIKSDLSRESNISAATIARLIGEHVKSDTTLAYQAFADVDSFMHYSDRTLFISEKETAKCFGLGSKNTEASRCLAAHIQGIFKYVLSIVADECGQSVRVLTRNHVFDAINKHPHDLSLFIDADW